MDLTDALKPLAVLPLTLALVACGGSDFGIEARFQDGTTVSNSSPRDDIGERSKALETGRSHTLQMKISPLDGNTFTQADISSAEFPGITRLTTNPNESLTISSVKPGNIKIRATGVSPEGKVLDKDTLTLRIDPADFYMNHTGGGNQYVVAFLPDKAKYPGPRPTLLFVHGGGWYEGDYTYFYKNARDAAKDGYLAFTMNYRLTSDGQSYQKVWPAQIEDMRCAVQWIHSQSRNASFNVDSNRIGVVGYSAGTQIALMAALASTNEVPNADGYSARCKHPDESSAIHAVALMSAISSTADLVGHYLNNPTATSKGGVCQSYWCSSTSEVGAFERVTRLVGQTPKDFEFVKAAYATGAPDWEEALYTQAQGSTNNRDLLEKLRSTSPLRYTSNARLPVLLMHGVNDKIIPFSQSEKLACVLQRNTTVYLRKFTLDSNTQGHGWGEYDNATSPKSVARTTYTAFFSKHLLGQSTTITSDTPACN